MSLLTPDEEKPDVRRIGTVFRLGLHIDFEQPAKAVEIIHVGPAQKRAQSGIHIGRGNTHLQYHVIVDVCIDLRDVGAECRNHIANLRPFLRRLYESLGLAGQVLGGIAAPVLQHHAEA